MDQASVPAGDSSFGNGSLFVEIGHTLEMTANDVASGTASALRTAVARQVLNSQEGQAEVVSVRNQQIGKFLPIIILAVLALIFFARRV